jgi:hypothetical protein
MEQNITQNSEERKEEKFLQHSPLMVPIIN